MQKETLGDWCKWLEKNFSPEIAIPRLPVIIRIDGNNFSKWTKGLVKPFDARLVDLMHNLTKYLVKETNALIGYTQSDEITLILYTDDRRSGIYHEGKKQKILSKLTSKVTSFFNSHREFGDRDAIFDCRMYQTPTIEDAIAQLIWRENDAERNSISGLARTVFTHKQMIGVSGKDLIVAMEKNSVYWNRLPTNLRRGAYFMKTNSEGVTEVQFADKLSNVENRMDLILNSTFQ